MHVKEFFLVYLFLSIYCQKEIFYVQEDEAEMNENALEEETEISEREDATDTPKVEVLDYKSTKRIPYYFHFVTVVPLILYFVNQFYGSRKNKQILATFFDHFKETVLPAFTDVAVEANKLKLAETEMNTYTACLGADDPCLGYDITITLLNRSDIMFSLWNKIHKNRDLLEITALVSPTATVEKFILFLGRRSALMTEEQYNATKFLCREHREVLGNMPEYITLLTEVYETASALLCDNLLSAIGADLQSFNYLFISDLPDGHTIKSSLSGFNPKVNYMLVKLSLNLTNTGIWTLEVNMHERLLHEFALIVRKINQIQLSRESRAAIEKSRVKFNEQRSKEEHQKRQELAMKKKDEKIRQRKQLIMAEKDSQKQIKLQEKFDKMELKQKNKKLTKGKAYKVIA